MRSLALLFLVLLFAAPVAAGTPVGEPGSLSGWQSAQEAGRTSSGASPAGRAHASVSPVPEPGTVALLGMGLTALALRRRSRQ